MGCCYHIKLAVDQDKSLSLSEDAEAKALVSEPDVVLIKGDKGDKGDRGEQGIQGVQGLKGETGEQGQKGADGTPATHRWSGTTLYITSASGTSSANLKGEKGDKGDPGTNGKDGINGKDGVDGKNGADGRTPIKGTDYFTEADKAEMVSAVISALPKYNGEVVAE